MFNWVPKGWLTNYSTNLAAIGGALIAWGQAGGPAWTTPLGLFLVVAGGGGAVAGVGRKVDALEEATIDQTKATKAQTAAVRAGK